MNFDQFPSAEVTITLDVILYPSNKGLFSNLMFGLLLKLYSYKYISIRSIYRHKKELHDIKIALKKMFIPLSNFNMGRHGGEWSVIMNTLIKHTRKGICGGGVLLKMMHKLRPLETMNGFCLHSLLWHLY